MLLQYKICWCWLTTKQMGVSPCGRCLRWRGSSEKPQSKQSSYQPYHRSLESKATARSKAARQALDPYASLAIEAATLFYVIELWMIFITRDVHQRDPLLLLEVCPLCPFIFKTLSPYSLLTLPLYIKIQNGQIHFSPLHMFLLLLDYPSLLSFFHFSRYT